MPRVRRVFFAALFLAAPFAAAQGCASRGPDLVARMTAAKSIYESVGYTAFGSPSMGQVAEGGEGKVALSLKEGCYQIVAFPGDGLKGVDLALNDPAGKTVGEVKKQDGQTSVKQCVQESGTYNLIVKSSGGSGSFIVQPYVSGEKVTPKGPDEPGVVEPACVGEDCPEEPGYAGGGGDPCTNAADLTAGGSIKGTTVNKGYAPHAACAIGEGPSAVYRVHVEGRHKLVLDLSAKFDAVMSMYRAAHDGYLCDSPEIDCSDDSEGQTNKSHIEAVVDTGDYGVVITGYDGANDKGDFELKSRLEDAPSLETVCAAARAATVGGKSTDFVSSEGSNFRASCNTMDGSEALFKFDLKGRSRVRLGMKSSSGGESSISVRKRCEDANTEIVCAKDWHIDGVSWTGLMDAGAYTVITETNDTTHSASVDLTIDRADAAGSGTADGDTCKDAKPLPLGTQFTLDTFQAKADMRASCAADSAADIAYKIDVKAKSRLFLTTTEDEGHHVYAIQKACGDTKGEVSCEAASTAKGIDTTLDPGSYYLVVKGKGPDDFGRAKVSARMRELAPAAAACKAATKLVSGTPLKNETTTGAPDRFASEKCGGTVWNQNSGDKVYQFTLKERSKVNLSLKNSFYNAIMSLRTDCADPTRNELVCSSYYQKTLDRDLDPGTYYVVVDGYGPKSEGAYDIELTAKPIK